MVTSGWLSSAEQLEQVGASSEQRERERHTEGEVRDRARERDREDRDKLEGKTIISLRR